MAKVQFEKAKSFSFKGNEISLIKALICYTADSHLPAPKLWIRKKSALSL